VLLDLQRREELTAAAQMLVIKMKTRKFLLSIFDVDHGRT